MTPGIVPPRGNKHAVKQLHPSADVTFRPARCLLTEPDLALFAVLMESREPALKGGPAWEESWRSAGESLRAERARLRGILNTSSADKKHSLPYCSPHSPPPYLTPSLLHLCAFRAVTSHLCITCLPPCVSEGAGVLLCVMRVIDAGFVFRLLSRALSPRVL